MEPSTTDETKELAQETRETWEQTKQAAQRDLQARKGSLAQEVQGIARALRGTAEHLQQENSAASGYASRAAQTVERFGQTLSDKNVSELISDLERACRDKPLLVGGVSALAGFLGSRVLRSAVESQTHSSHASHPSLETPARELTGAAQVPQSSVQESFEEDPLSGGI